MHHGYAMTDLLGRVDDLARFCTLYALCAHLSVPWRANCVPPVLLLSAWSDCGCCKTQPELHSLLYWVPGRQPTLHCFLSHPLPPRLQSGRITLIFIAGQRNTGPVVDVLASYPTGADKLLASLSVQSEDIQAANESVQPNSRTLNWAAGWETICRDQLCLSVTLEEMWEHRDPVLGWWGQSGHVWTSCCLQNLTVIGIHRHTSRRLLYFLSFCFCFYTSPWRVK